MPSSHGLRCISSLNKKMGRMEGRLGRQGNNESTNLGLKHYQHISLVGRTW